MMNITRFTLSIALLFSVNYITAHEGCEHKAVSAEITSVETVSLQDIVKQAVEDFDLTNDEVTELTARLEATGENADVAAIVAEIRTENAEVAPKATPAENAVQATETI